MGTPGLSPRHQPEATPPQAARACWCSLLPTVALQLAAALSSSNAAAEPRLASSQPPPTHPTHARAGWLSKAAHKVASYVSFAPMILMGAVPDVRVAAAAAAAAAVFNLLGSALLYRCRVYKARTRDIVSSQPRSLPTLPVCLLHACWRRGMVNVSPPPRGQACPDTLPPCLPARPQVWPKGFDVVNAAIYCTMAAVAHTHPVFTSLWSPVFTNGLTGIYFAGSLLVGRPFCMDMAKESAPPEVRGWPWGGAGGRHPAAAGRAGRPPGILPAA